MRFPEKYRDILTGESRESRVELTVGCGGTVKRRLGSHSLAVSRPLYPEGDLPHFILINSSGGLVQGDRLFIDVRIDDEARAHLTTQSANRIYRMECGCAVQETSIAAGENAFLEYLPDPNIPFKGSNLFQQTTVDLRRSSTFFSWDIVHPGRYASGERFEMGVYFSGLRLRIDGRQVLADTIVLEPAKRAHATPGILGNASFIAAVYIYCRDAEALGKALKVPCCINHAGVLVVRLPGEDWLAMQKALEQIHQVFREHEHLSPLANRRG